MPPALRDGAPEGARALSAKPASRRPRPTARADRPAQGRHRVPGRAHDHADRAARPADVHRLPAGHQRPEARRRRAARVAGAPRRGRRRGAEADPAEPPRRCAAAAHRRAAHPRPSARDRCRGDALLDVAIEELAAGLQEIRELASGLHPSMLAERGLGAALEALALRAPCPVELAHAARPTDCRSRSRPPPTTSLRRLSPTFRNTPARSRVVVERHSRRAHRCSSRSATTASAERTRRAPGCAASRIASRHSGAGSR